MQELLAVVTEELGIMIDDGGIVMYPLIGAALLLWLGLGYRAIMLRRGSSLPVRSLVASAQNDALADPKGFVDTAAAIATAAARRHVGELRAVLDDELFFLEDRLGRYRTLVRTIVVVAPLAGLLGTVNGMIEMFRSLGTQTFYSQSGGVANGISQALLTTQLGLVIAIPGMIVGRLLDRREHRMREDITQIKELLVSSQKEHTA